MSSRRSLRRRILYWLSGYAVLLAAGVFLHGFLVNEYAERLLWDSLLRTEFDHYLERINNDPAYRWSNTDSLSLYIDHSATPPPEDFDELPDGIHDELVLSDGTEVLVLVRHVGGVRHILSLDITELEEKEDTLTLFVLGSTITLVTLMGLLMLYGLGRALRPLADLAAAITRLSPHRGGQRVDVSERASSELVVIAGALNDYLERNERFVERERAFIDSASHELRTPMAVILGATELALEQPGLPDAAREQVQRAHRTASEVEQLISLLLVLAKDPAKLARSTDIVALDDLLPELVEDHRYLTSGKRLALRLSPLPSCRIDAPIAIVQAAIGNLLRNAIENSDQGDVLIELSRDATVTISDPGHGMDPDQISQLYAQLARGSGRGAGGIGLDLVSRLCTHLGWRLTIESTPGHGTVSTLRFNPTVTPSVDVDPACGTPQDTPG